MPAATRTGGEDRESSVDVDPGGAAPSSTVIDHLDSALAVAREQHMAASELIGLLFYYAHCVAEGHRQDALENPDGS